ncbi:uncharacterized protein [Gossypium hirsutum]|uniref:Uncharacterized protein isoform X2 n=1 Tax=Gossypium hirsutum TaxID=3635 RepID=A0ABM3BJL5_GOSHI|nr:uncharacterized protein LOC121228139 isoform X2 [Gossypium hirsutum]
MVQHALHESVDFQTQDLNNLLEWEWIKRKRCQRQHGIKLQWKSSENDFDFLASETTDPDASCRARPQSQQRLAVLHISQAVLAYIKYDNNDDALIVESNHKRSNLSCWMKYEASGFGVKAPSGEVTKRAGTDEIQKKNQ